MKNKIKIPKLSKYPKQRLSFNQVKDEEKLEKYRKKKKIKQFCPKCGNDNFFIDTLGIEHCGKCFYPTNVL
jgi:ribosomal protein S27AE